MNRLSEFLSGFEAANKEFNNVPVVTEPVLKAVIVCNDNGRFVVHETTVDKLVDFAWSLGFVQWGVNDNPRNRIELQGKPRFSGLLGPMWDGDKIRYEDQTVYDRLSV